MTAPSAPLLKLWDGSYLARMLPDGEQSASHKTFLFGDSFEGVTLESLWTTSLTGTGFVQVFGGVATFGTGSTANSTAKFSSTILNPYQPGLVSSVYAVVRLDSSSGTAANNTIQFGLYDLNNGYGFQIAGGVISAWRSFAGSGTTVALNGSAGVVNTNPHAYEIVAYGNVVQLLQDGVILHTFNVVTLGGSRSLTLPIAFENNNTGGSTTNCQPTVMEVGVCRYGGEGAPVYLSKRINTNATTVLKNSPGLLRGLLIGVGGSGSTATFYDNTSAAGTVLFVATTTGTNYLGPLEIPFYTGLTVVTAGTGAADLQITWR